MEEVSRPLSDKDMPRDQWVTQRIDFLVDLLHTMALVLNYEFDKTHIKNSAYAPVAHGDIEDQQAAVRMGVIDILEGKRVLPMYVTNFPANEGDEEAIKDKGEVSRS